MRIKIQPVHIARFAALFMIALFAWPLFQGRVYLIDDLTKYSIPVRAIYADYLKQGVLPLWYPNYGAGTYMHAEGQAGMMHPLHLILYRIFPTSPALMVNLVLAYALLLYGTQRLLRSFNLVPAAAWLGAIVFTFCGINYLRTVHVNAIEMIAHLPWSLLCLHGLIANQPGRARRLYFLGFALLTGSQCLLGYPQYMLIIGVVELLYVAVILSAKISVHSILVYVAAKVVGVLIGAVQVLPTVMLLLDSDRSELAPGHTMSGSFAPLNMLQMIGPYLLKKQVVLQYNQDIAPRLFNGNEHEFAFYYGAALIGVVLCYVFTKKSPVAHLKLRKFAFGLVGVGFLLSLGSYFPPNELISHIPLLSSFRVPARYLILVALGISTLAGLAMDRRLREADHAQWTTWSTWPVVLFGVLATVYMLVALLVDVPAYIRFWGMIIEGGFAPPPKVLASWLIVISGACLVWAFLAGRRWTAVLGMLLIAHVAIDLSIYGLRYLHHPPPYALASLLDEYREARCPDTGGRCATVEAYAGDNLFSLVGCDLLSYYAGLNQSKLLDYATTSALRVASCQWIRVKENGTNRWVEIDKPLPRVKLYGNAMVTSNPVTDLLKIDLQRMALVDRPVEAAEDVGATASYDRPGPSVIRVECTTQTNQLLFVSEGYDAGWYVTVDGKNAKLVRVFGDFIGCEVSAGTHLVEFRFNPKSFTRGLTISMASLFFLVIYAGRRR